MEPFAAELSDDQRFEMLHVTFPDNRWSVNLRPTDEIEQAYREWLGRDCQHKTKRELRRKPIKSGNPQIVEVCPDCGMQFGTPIAYSKVGDPEAIPWMGALNYEEYHRERREEWRDKKIAFWAAQETKIDAEYEAYLKSEKWKTIRRKVVLRAQGICEGCRNAPATEVHHLSYEHRFDEFLWELVAVCDACHERAHRGQK